MQGASRTIALGHLIAVLAGRRTETWGNSLQAHGIRSCRKKPAPFVEDDIPKADGKPLVTGVRVK